MEEKQKKYCRKCGNELEISAKFCKACGTSQEISNGQQSQQNTSESQQKSKLPLIGIGLASCFALSAVLLSSFFAKEENPKENLEGSIPVSDPVIEMVVPQIEETPVETVTPEIEVLPDEMPEENIEATPIKGVDMSNIERKQLTPSYATASSEFPNWGSYTYVANNVIDNNENTAWVENAPELGIGEWVEVHFDLEPVEEIQFYNGYGDNYENNGVLGEVAIQLSGGETFVYSVGDRWNTLVLPYALETSSVRLTILSSTTGKDLDTCISEVKIFNKSEELPTSELSSEQSGVHGDFSGLSQEQARGFVEVLDDLQREATSKAEEYNETGIGHEPIYAQVSGVIFDAGFGIPMMMTVTNIYEDIKITPQEPGDYGIQEVSMNIWEWDEQQVIKVESPQYSTHYISDLLEKDNKYYLYVDSIPLINNDGNILPHAIVSTENGKIGTIVDCEILYSRPNANYLDEDIKSLVEHPILSRIDTVNLRNSIYERFENVDTWTEEIFDQHGNFVRVSQEGDIYSEYLWTDNSFKSVVSCGIFSGVFFTEYIINGNWTDSNTLKAWLQSQAHK